MKKLGLLFKKSILVTIMAALALAALPLSNASATGLNDPSTPPAGEQQISNERIEQIWVRLQEVYARQGQLLERADQVTERFQNIVDRMNVNGKDTTALQVALAAFEDALKDAHPIYESAKGIIKSHKGFDADGNVTDHEQAIETVRELSSKMREVRQLVGEPGKALREALQALRDANRPVDTSGTQG